MMRSWQRTCDCLFCNHNDHSLTVHTRSLRFYMLIFACSSFGQGSPAQCLCNITQAGLASGAECQQQGHLTISQPC